MSCLKVRSMISDFCSNYDLIINYVDNDLLTRDIINEYRAFLTNNNDILAIQTLDYIIGIYLKDKKFYNFVHQNYIEYNDKYILTLDMVKYLYQKYHENKEEIKVTKWL